ncbi:MAG: PEP-CTERM sorting domain-containing protein [Acidobacteria bacterium]|nr:PEP-CTERM sorting domain-containing protein [Acidobacteriota bacterium]
MRLAYTSLPFLALLLAAPAIAAPIVTNTVDTETAFTLVGHGGMYNTVTTWNFAPYTSPSGFWFLQLTVVEGQSFFNNDVVTVTGTVQHLKSPTGHGDGPGFAIPFTMTINASGPLNDAFLAGKAHGGHSDSASGALSGISTPYNLIAYQFSSYDFNIDVRHVPEPAGLGALGLGLLLAARVLRKR